MAKSKSHKTHASSEKTTVRHIKVARRRFGQEIALGPLFAELIGTFVLTAAVLITAGNAIVAALAVLVMVLVVAQLSGGHINPAVTISLFTLRQISHWKALGYIVAQVLGAMLALVLVANFMGNSQAGLGPELYKVQPSTEVWKPFFAELLGALVLGFGIASAVLGKKQGYECAFTIGGALLLGLLVATLGSAAVLNPAVALGVSAYTSNWASVLAYAAGPILGVAAGVWLFKLMQWDVNNSKKDA